MKVADARHTVADDTLKVSPTSHEGYQYIIVMVNLFTHVVMLHKSKERNAVSIADALMHWIANRNLFRHLQHDPGSDIMSEVVQVLIGYLGIKDCVTLVNSPRSNGVEPINKQVLRHLNTLVHDKRLVEHWSDNKFLDLVQFELNNWFQSEVGAIPFEAEMGSTEVIYRSLPESSTTQERRVEYVKQLDEWLRIIRASMRKWQLKIVDDRKKGDPEIINTYAIGDLVLQEKDTAFRQFKLSAPFVGPFKVVGVCKDDVTIIHLSSNEQCIVKNETLKPFFGTLEEAVRVAQLDYDHHVVSERVAYTGDPLVRKTLEFEVHYADGDWEWRRYSPDIASTEAFKTFVDSKPELYLLKFQTTQN